MNEEQEKRTEAEKLIIFGWIITIVPEMQNWCAGDPVKRAKINKLVDKMHELMAADSRTRKDAGKLDIKMRVVEYDEKDYDKVKHEVFITRNLGTLMTDDDGGLYGVEQAQADAAEEVYGDHMLYENFTVEEMEVMLPKPETVYYALKHKDGHYYRRSGSEAAALFVSPGRAKAALKSVAMLSFHPEDWNVVNFGEVA